MEADCEEYIDKLVDEMGFDRTQARMALVDCGGDVQKAIDKLLSGEYAPPPYEATASETQSLPRTQQHAPPAYESTILQPQSSSSATSPLIPSNENTHELYPNVKDFFSDLLHRGKKPDVVTEDPTAPPLCSVDVPPGASAAFPGFDRNIETKPPPYQKHETGRKIEQWEKEMNIVYISDLGERSSADERCPVCFNPLFGSPSASSWSGKEQFLSHRGKVFHSGCFLKKHGPRCSHCHFPLSQPDKELLMYGEYLVYKNKDYHVECYEKYAGPRCGSCFNVIIEKPSAEHSGSWVVDRGQDFHVECLQKKLQTASRAMSTRGFTS